MRCANCGDIITPGAKFCSECSSRRPVTLDVELKQGTAANPPVLVTAQPLAVPPDLGGPIEPACAPRGYCQLCGEKLTFWQRMRAKRCAACRRRQVEEQQAARAQQRAAFQAAQDATLHDKSLPDGALDLFSALDHRQRLALFNHVRDTWEKADELDLQAVECLTALMHGLDLSYDDVDFENRVQPYFYADLVRRGQPLPLMDGRQLLDGSIVMRRGEGYHFVVAALLQEFKTIGTHYVSGSRGISFPIGHTGIRYRVGATRGHTVREEGWVPISRGLLILTNQRILLHPADAGKPVSIPLAKVLSYTCFEDGIMVYKDGREKGYFFRMAKGAPPETFGLCLGYLLQQGA